MVLARSGVERAAPSRGVNDLPASMETLLASGLARPSPSQPSQPDALEVSFAFVAPVVHMHAHLRFTYVGKYRYSKSLYHNPYA